VKRTVMAWMVGFLLFGNAVVVAADDLAKPTTRISQDLADLAAPAASAATMAAPDSLSVWNPSSTDDWVTIDAVGTGDPRALEVELISLGARNTAVAGRVVSARLPISAIPSLEGVTSLRFARQALRTTSMGLVTSQGDKAMRADIVRNNFGLDGSGVKVGVLSDSFDCRHDFATDAADDLSSNDLSPVEVLQDLPGCTNNPIDEGRAILQIVHDVAPGADLAFATAFTGQAGFANNIRALRDAGAKVIVDDVIYFAEPMFQDGIIAQAVDEVVASGVAYFSSAGNNARAAYDHAFVPGTPLGPGAFGGSFLGGTPHVFSGTTNIRQSVTFPQGITQVVLQWDSPFFSSGGTGTTNDLDIYFFSVAGNLLFQLTTNNISSGDPVETTSVSCGGSCIANIMVVRRTGPDPGRLKIGYLTNGAPISASPALNSGTIYGHANANGAIAVGAANYKTPTTLESFSSGGTTPVLFDTDGNLLQQPDPRQFKPEIVAPDGANTTFFFPGNDPESDGFPNFFGTSAAAPHAAAVAALMLQAMPLMTPTEVRDYLETTALNMGPAGFDNNTGFGLVQADATFNALHIFQILAGPTGTPNPVTPGAPVSLFVDATDSFGHSLTYGWASTCTGGLAPGIFDDASSPSTAWTAAANATGQSQTCSLKVTVTDGNGFTRTGTHTATVLSKPRITSVSPQTATAGASIVIGGMSLAGTTEVTFSGPVTVSPTNVTATSVTVIVPVDTRTGVFSLKTSAGVGASSTIFKVAPKITGFTPASAVGGSADLVDVTGTNLLAASGTPTVKIGGTTVPASLITLHTLTALQFKVPLGATTAQIDVTTVDGTAQSATSLSVGQPPRATGFGPNPAAVGTTVTISGTNLAGVTAVTFTGAAPAAPLPGGTASSLKTVVPAGAVTGPVTLTNPVGTSASTVSLRVAPKITGFTPASVVGGSADLVDVTGTNLLGPSGTPTVKIGGTTVPASLITVHTLTALQFKAPLGATTAQIGVTTVDGTALSPTSLVVQQPPRATGFSPNPAPVGTTVTITGTNLAGVAAVMFTGAAPAAPLPGGTASSLKAVVPAGAITGPVTLTNPVGTSASTVAFRVAPKITGFTPASVVGGSADLVNVTGTNLLGPSGTPTVRIGGMTVPASLITLHTLTALQLKAPLGATTGKIGVTTVDGTAQSATDLAVGQPPRATGFSPNPAPVGTTVTITGTNLAGVTAVTFTGAAPVAPLPGGTPSSLKAIVPAGAVTGPVTLTNPVGTSASTVAFRVAPKITGFTPASVVGGSADLVDVTGTNLLGPSGTPTVRIGGMTVPASLITLHTLTALQLKAPLGATTGKIGVTTVDGTAQSATDLVVQQPPRATGFSPNPAPVGATVTITGTNLGTVTAITFNGAAPVAPTLSSPSSMQVVVPSDAVTGLVSLTNSTGTGTSTTTFKVAPKITGFTPASAVGGSADLIDVTGTNLLGPSGTPTVRIGGTTVPASLITLHTLTALQLKAPLGATTGKIGVTTVDGTAQSATDLVITQPPRATGFGPNPAAVGTTVTISGTNLAGVTAVTFTGAGPVAPLPGGTASSLKAVVPAGAITGPVTLTNPVGTSASTVAFRVAPKITGFTPASAVGGSADLVDVTGTNLLGPSGTPTVRIGGMTVPASLITLHTLTALQLKVPLGATTAQIGVTTVDGTALSPTNLVVQQPPRATSFSPNLAAVGATVTVNGTNLAGVTAVTFTGAAPVAPLPGGTASSLKAVVPAGAVTGPVGVANSVGTTTSSVTFKLLPKITSLPSEAALGSDVVISGTNLKTGSSHPIVKIGAVAATVVDSSPTQVTFTVPPLAVTGNVTITTADGTATSPTSMTVMPGSIGL
jgi:hypothetical protein